MGPAPVNGKALPAFLILTLLVPTAAGLYRAAALIWDWEWALNFAAQNVDNLPLFLHAVFGISFIVFGGLQLLPGFRARNPRWHRSAGRWTATAGILAALTGLWMTLLHPNISTALLFYGRIVASLLWAVFILLAVRFVIQKNIAKHRAFMIRAYAIAINAGTLPFIYIPIMIVYGVAPPLIEDAIQVTGWIVNLSVAEWIIRRQPKPSLPQLINAQPI